MMGKCLLSVPWLFFCGQIRMEQRTVFVSRTDEHRHTLQFRKMLDLERRSIDDIRAGESFSDLVQRVAVYRN
jgi:hypothetical protein